MDFKQQPAPTPSTYLITVSALFLHWPVISHYVYFIPKASEKHGSMALRERSLVVERRNSCPHRRAETHNYSLKVAEAHTRYINVLRNGCKGQQMIWWMWVKENEMHSGRGSRLLCEPCKGFHLWLFFGPWTVVPGDVHATKILAGGNTFLISFSEMMNGNIHDPWNWSDVITLAGPC